MKSPLQWLLSSQLKRSHSNQQFSGFTLIELLVGLILAVLVITPLLGFMINIMDTDHKELVKTTSEQEIKAALDYIARDLQEAVYIYDADGITEIRDQLPKYDNDNKSKFFPVLVFWKRQFIRDAVKATSTSDCAKKPDTCNDALVYSLVAYYLIKDGDATWSKTARIGRFQISNGYGNTEKEIKDTTDDGFQLFSLEGTGTLKEKMNKWTNSKQKYQQDVLTLVDYIDQTPISSDETNPAPSCSLSPPMQLIPQFSGSGDSVASGDIRTRSFYACVNSDSTVAEVYLRGNAIARIENPPATYRKDISIYFPQASVRVQGRGFLFSK